MKKIIILSICLFALGAGCGKTKSTQSIMPTNSTSETRTETATNTPQNSMVSVMVPEDIEKYRTEITRFKQVGGEDPLKTTVFVKKEVTLPYVPYSTHIMTASVEAAAHEVYKQGGGPAAVTVEQLEIIDGTAYVLLNIDTDGWAGVSVAQAIVHPVVAKTLAQFEGIKKITFGPVQNK